jgi:hypothetical protein
LKGICTLKALGKVKAAFGGAKGSAKGNLVKGLRDVQTRYNYDRSGTRRKLMNSSALGQWLVKAAPQRRLMLFCVMSATPVHGTAPILHLPRVLASFNDSDFVHLVITNSETSFPRLRGNLIGLKRPGKGSGGPSKLTRVHKAMQGLMMSSKAS